MSASIGIRAGRLDAAFPGDPADRIIYATALESASLLVTSDRSITRFDPTRVIW